MSSGHSLGIAYDFNGAWTERQHPSRPLGGVDPSATESISKSCDQT